MTTDPLGLTEEQRSHSDMWAIADKFIAAFGQDRIEMAPDGAWFVREQGRIVTIWDEWL